MNADEREKHERWAKWVDEMDDGFERYPPMGLIYLARRFPIPNTDGMSPAEAEATLARWRAEVDEFTAATQNGSATPSATPAAQPPAAAEAPVA